MDETHCGKTPKIYCNKSVKQVYTYLSFNNAPDIHSFRQKYSTDGAESGARRYYVNCFKSRFRHGKIKTVKKAFTLISFLLIEKGNTIRNPISEAS